MHVHIWRGGDMLERDGVSLIVVRQIYLYTIPSLSALDILTDQ